MPNLIRRKQVDQTEFSGFFVEVGNVNYYPLTGNPSSFITNSNLSTATGQVNVNLLAASGVLSSQSIQYKIDSLNYTDSASGALSARLESTGSTLSGSINSLSGYVNTVSGDLTGQIYATSGVLNTKINTSSGDLKTYINSVSGVLSAEIINNSTSGSASAIASGIDFQFSGAKKFVSPISVPRINLSGVSAPSEIAIVASSGQVSIVGSAGTFMSFVESGVGSSVNSLWAATDVAGIPVIEIFDDYTVVFGRASSKAIIVSGISGYLIMPSLPNETQISSLPASTIYKSGGYIRIK
jgi:hypothetical protein